MKSLFKRLSALVLAAAVFCGIPNPAFFAAESGKRVSYAASGNWSQYCAAAFAGGNGTVTEPFLIETAGQLALMAQNINGNATNTIVNGEGISPVPYNKAFYKLNYNSELNGGVIDLAAHSFTPIGSVSSYAAEYNSDTAEFAPSDLATVFSGHFNGEYFLGGERKFFEISGLNGGALFGAADSAYIRNFDLTDVEIDGAGICGAVVNLGIDTEVRNVSVSGSITASGAAAGGIMGYGVRSSVFACENYADIASSAASGYAGGLAGAMVKGGLGDCINEGAVSGFYAGGIMGYGMQASINRSVSAGTVQGTTAGEFIGRFRTENSAPAASITALLGTGVETSTCIAEAGALIKDSFFNTDNVSGTVSGTLISSNDGTAGGLIGAINNPGQDYIRVKALDTVHMTGRMQQKLNMSDWQEDGSPDLLFYKWWSYNDSGLPRPVRWEMWTDSIAAKANAASQDDPTAGWIWNGTDALREWPKFTQSAQIITAEKLAYLAYMVNRGLLTDQKNLKILEDIADVNPKKYGNIDLSGKLWIPFGTIKNPYQGETFTGVTGIYRQSFISSMTINSALSYQSFFGVVEQPLITSQTLRVNFVHLAGIDVWSGSIDMSAGFVSLYIHKFTSSVTRTCYYQFLNCITSGSMEAYGNAVGMTAGFIGSLSAPTPTTVAYEILSASGNAADIVSFAGNACGLIFTFSNINSAISPTRFGIINCFNSGKISTLKGSGTASGLFSDVNATSISAIQNCYNSGELYTEPDGRATNYIGSISGSSSINFTGCYYRNDYARTSRINDVGTTGTSFLLSDMQQGIITPTGNWFLEEGCNNDCPIPEHISNYSYSANRFYEVTLDYDRHEGDVILASKIVSMPNVGNNSVFACIGSVLTAYPIIKSAGNAPEWFREDSENGYVSLGTRTEYSAGNFAAGLCDFKIEFKHVNSVTAVADDTEKGVVSILSNQIAIPSSLDYYDTGIGRTYIYREGSNNVISVAAAAKPGYRFDGWYTALGGTRIASQNVYDILDSVFPDEKDIILYAAFIADSGGTGYNISFGYTAGCNSGMGSIPVGISAGEGYAEFEFVATPETGYRFAGWYADLAGTDLVSETYSFSYTVSADITFYAKFIRIYTVQIHAGPGVGDQSAGTVRFTLPDTSQLSIVVDVGQTVRFTAVATENYAFGGWYADSDFTSDPVYQNAAVTVSSVSADMHFYARFLPQYKLKTVIRITIGESAGGEAEGEGDYEEGETATLRAISDKGYRFAGWYDAWGNFVSGEAEYSFTVYTSVKYTPFFQKDRRAEYAVLSASGGIFILLSCCLFAWFYKGTKANNLYAENNTGV